MKRLIVLASLLCISNTNDLPIPVQYQGGAAVLVHMVDDQKTLDTMCGGPPPKGQRLGCETADNKAEVVVMNPCRYPEAIDVHSFAHLMCHEKAHVNGWRHQAPF